MQFPPFDLQRLLKTVFDPQNQEKVCILIDLEDPAAEMKDFAFLKNQRWTIQKRAHQHFYLGLKNGVAEALNLTGGEMFAYKITGGSNLDLPDECFDELGRQLSFEKDIYPVYDLILCISTYSATAPLTASAKKHGFRGATLHGLNDIILSSGLAVDYNLVSEQAERLRQGMSKADAVEMDFKAFGREGTLRLELAKQDAQKSHGLCRGSEPDVANLPAGEVYYVPAEGKDYFPFSKGHFPLKFEDGSMGWLKVTDGKVVDAECISGNPETIDAFRTKVQTDSAAGWLGELGFGTQELPVSGQDIQDEKIFGTFHVATGRNDHLGGSITPAKFKDKQNATHDDILFSPEKTPEVEVPQVRLYRDGEVHVLFENYQAKDYLKALAYGQPV